MVDMVVATSSQERSESIHWDFVSGIRDEDAPETLG